MTSKPALSNLPSIFIIILAAILVVGLLAVLALGVWVLVIWVPNQPSIITLPIDSNTTNNSIPVVIPPINSSTSNNSSVIHPTEEEIRLQMQWNLIINDRVQSACLSEAKATAESSGYNEALVWGCNCIAGESESVKSYDCKVSAIDGQHPVSIVCTKSLKSCQIDSARGSGVYTFDELEELANS